MYKKFNYRPVKQLNLLVFIFEITRYKLTVIVLHCWKALELPTKMCPVLENVVLCKL
uniref:Uncharacterized protein n=1 Tax=Anguilla anguilla TaxID=7936 RepID=A0A0E9VQD3_ANGAN